MTNASIANNTFTESPSRTAFWTGWILSILPALVLLFGGISALLATPEVVEGTSQMGYPSSLLRVIGTLEILCTLLYLIPQTAVFGALLLTAYFGGAVASHLRMGQAKWPIAVVFAIVLWTGLILRRPTLREILFPKREE